MKIESEESRENFLKLPTEKLLDWREKMIAQGRKTSGLVSENSFKRARDIEEELRKREAYFEEEEY